MPPNPSADEIPVFEDPDVRDLHYHESEAEGEPYLAVERYDEGYAVTFDLMPAGVQLTADGQRAVKERLVAEVEAVVGDADSPELEISHNLGAALGSVAAFEDVTTAQRLAASVAEPLLDESNWTEHRAPAEVDVSDLMQN